MIGSVTLRALGARDARGNGAPGGPPSNGGERAVFAQAPGNNTVHIVYNFRYLYDSVTYRSIFVIENFRYPHDRFFW